MDAQVFVPLARQQWVLILGITQSAWHLHDKRRFE